MPGTTFRQLPLDLNRGPLIPWSSTATPFGKQGPGDLLLKKALSDSAVAADTCSQMNLWADCLTVTKFDGVLLVQHVANGQIQYSHSTV